MKRSYQIIGLLTGAVLGFGAPAGALLLGMTLSGKYDSHWIALEISDHFYYYAYMTVATPLVFCFFGSYLGRLNDTIRSKTNSLGEMLRVVEDQSMSDDVTGLYNHRHLMEEIEKEIERSKRYKHSLSGIMVDVDDFKEINDLYGHLAGDKVLRDVAAMLNESIRKIDIIGRYGGDEFMIIIPEAGAEVAKTISERILKNIQQIRIKDAKEGAPLTVSVGLFSFQNPNELSKTLFIEKIDQAMYQAKSLGKNQYYSLT